MISADDGNGVWVDKHRDTNGREFSVRLDYRNAVVQPHGEFDAAGVPAFMEAARTLISANPTGDALIIDLADVTFLDSSGLGAMVALCNVAEMSGMGVALRSVPARVTRLIKTTGLENVFARA
jgi:anti-sigma B factor antagonist